MRVLVTGADGFVGRRLVDRLRALGHEVVGGVLSGRPAPGEATLDVTDAAALAALHRDFGTEGIVHLAALSDVAASWKELAEYFRVNVQAVENVVVTAPAGATVVFASSAEVYGRVPPSELPAREDRALAPATPYAMTKACAERVARPRGAIAARSFNLIGPGQSPMFALPAFAAQLGRIAAGQQEPVLRVGNLETRRDFLHVDDGVEGYAVLLERGAVGEVYNLCSGTAVRLSDALAELIRISGLEVRLELDPQRLRPADVALSLGDPARLRALGWSPRRGFEQALRDLWAQHGSTFPAE